MSTLKIGVVGYGARTRFNEPKAIRYLNEAFDTLARVYSDVSDIWVVSKGINAGIPRLAYDIALLREWSIAAIIPAEARGQDLYPIDPQYINYIGMDAGQESSAFLNEVDTLVRVGGDSLAHAEATRFKNVKGATKTYEYELDTI